MLNATARVRGRQRFVNRVKKQLAATAAAATPSASNDDSDSDADDLQYVPPIGTGDMRLYSYFGECSRATRTSSCILLLRAA